MANELDPLERAVLGLVETGEGRLGTMDLPRRDYDVPAILERLAARGLVERLPQAGGDRWRITAAGASVIHAGVLFDEPDELVAALRSGPGDLIARFGELAADPPRFAAALRRILATRKDAADAVAFGVLLLTEPLRAELGRELWTSTDAAARRALYVALAPPRLDLPGRAWQAFPDGEWDALLRAGVADPDGEVRRSAAALVFGTPRPTALGAELAGLLRSDDAGERLSAALALGAARDEASLSALLAAAAGSDVALATAAVRALGARPDGRRDALAGLGDARNEVRAAAAFVLAHVMEGLAPADLDALDRAAANAPHLRDALARYRARADKPRA